MADDLMLRRATEADSGLLLRWRNDPGVRFTARTQHEIGADEHAAWLERTLADPARMLLIAEEPGRGPIGQLRFDDLGEGEWEVTISVDTAQRGRRLGTRLLEAGVEWLTARVPGAGVIVANVQNDNERSRRAFAAAGFEAAGDGDASGFERLVRRFG